MAQRKPYNPNTAYGRKKRREQAQDTYNNLPPEQQAEWDATGFIITLVIIAVAALCFFLAGDNGRGFAKWMSR